MFPFRKPFNWKLSFFLFFNWIFACLEWYHSLSKQKSEIFIRKRNWRNSSWKKKDIIIKYYIIKILWNSVHYFSTSAFLTVFFSMYFFLRKCLFFYLIILATFCQFSTFFFSLNLLFVQNERFSYLFLLNKERGERKFWSKWIFFYIDLL